MNKGKDDKIFKEQLKKEYLPLGTLLAILACNDGKIESHKIVKTLAFSEKDVVLVCEECGLTLSETRLK